MQTFTLFKTKIINLINCPVCYFSIWCNAMLLLQSMIKCNWTSVLWMFGFVFFIIWINTAFTSISYCPCCSIGKLHLLNVVCVLTSKIECNLHPYKKADDWVKFKLISNVRCPKEAMRFTCVTLWVSSSISAGF